MATAPNQVWTWDITRLAGARKWETYPLYVVLDLFSRYVVAWMVAPRESADRARRLIREAFQKQAVSPGQLTLHQDRGAPMTAKTFSQLLIDLEILPSYSRPANRRRQPVLGEPVQDRQIRARVSGPLCGSGAGARLLSLLLRLV